MKEVTENHPFRMLAIKMTFEPPPSEGAFGPSEGV